MMGWTWRQQLWLLLQCMGLGVSLGMLYDLFGVVRLWRSRRRRSLFLTDALFGVLAALVTFFTALAIMDGRMHPLLFFGCAFGFTVQHLTLGRVASRALYRAGAALILAGLCAEGETLVDDSGGHIERGYCKIEKKLKAVGGHITRVDAQNAD